MGEVLQSSVNGNYPNTEPEIMVTGEVFTLTLSEAIAIQYKDCPTDIAEKVGVVDSLRPVFVRCDEKGDLEVVPEHGEGVHLAIEALIPGEPPMYFGDEVKALFQDGSAALVHCALSPDKMPEANINYLTQNGQVQISPAA